MLSLAAAILTGCGDAPEQAESSAEATSIANRADGCSAGLTVRLDDASMASRDGGAPWAADRLQSFKRSAGDAFKAIADRMCSEGRLDGRRLAKFRTLLVQSGSGATETAIYDDAEAVGPGMLVFQWTFVEEDLGLPDSKDIEDGLTCWADPAASICADRAP